MSKNIKYTIAVVSDYAWNTGGVEEFTLELIKNLSQNYQCKFVTWSDTAPSPEDFHDVTTITNGDVRQAWQVILEADYVIVLTSFNVRMLARLSLDLLSSHKKPYMVIVQTSAHSDTSIQSTTQQDAWLTDLINLSSVTICASETVRKSVSQLSGINTKANMKVIENGARLGGTSKRQRAKTRVSFIGRPTHAKGFDLFLRLADDLKGSGLSFAANTVSIPPPEKVDGVEWSWNLNNTELKDFFDDTDLLVVPYRKADGLPLAILEAINCGVPIMAIDSPAVTPLMTRHGQIVVLNDYKSLNQALLAWHKGDLIWKPPVPHTVNTLSEQIYKYLTIINSELNID